MQYFKEAEETIRLTESRQSNLKADLRDLPKEMRSALFSLNLHTNKELRPLIVTDENGDSYVILGNGENTDLAMTVYRHFPNSDVEIPLCLKLEIIKSVLHEIPESLWIEIEGVPLHVTPATFKEL